MNFGPKERENVNMGPTNSDHPFAHEHRHFSKPLKINQIHRCLKSFCLDHSVHAFQKFALTKTIGA